MKISDAGIDLIREFEGCKLTAYPDPATGGDPWTIGYGHTGPDVFSGLKITEDEAISYLRRDLETAEKCVNGCVKVTLTQEQFDALCSFVLNVGCGNLRKSTLLVKINDGDDVGAAEEFLRWDRAAGKQMAGLTRRRNAERERFLA
jgi:lysozyme